jgi:hypothetical protein
LAGEVKSQALDSGFSMDMEESGNRNFGVEHVGVILEVFIAGETYLDESRFQSQAPGRTSAFLRVDEICGDHLPDLHSNFDGELAEAGKLYCNWQAEGAVGNSLPGNIDAVGSLGGHVVRLQVQGVA